MSRSGNTVLTAKLTGERGLLSWIASAPGPIQSGRLWLFRTPPVDGVFQSSELLLDLLPDAHRFFTCAMGGDSAHYCFETHARDRGRGRKG